MSTRNLPLFTVDAFSKIPFKGNGAAVVVLPHNEVIPDKILQDIATEMNLSETAYVTPREDEGPETATKFHLRWFTPKREVDLCGHATMATAAVIFNHYGNQSDWLEFETLSGKVYAKRSSENKITMDFPSYPPQVIEIEPIQKLIEETVGKLPVMEVLLSSSKNILIRLDDQVTRKDFEAFKTDARKQLELAKGQDIIGIIVTIKNSSESYRLQGEQEYDFLSRYFAPWCGVNEDPVTGSTHSVLAPYWSEVLGKQKLIARQCSSRGGELFLEVSKDRVFITGNTVTVIQGRINF